MMPLYKYMDSFPHQTSQVPFVQYQAFPPHMEVDPTKPPMAYGAWPFAPNYGHPIPCQPCCSHGNFSAGYGFRPSYPVMQMPMHYYGHHLGYPEAYHVPYAPPHYSKELPRYEYDKNVPRENHCCGCSNHSCQQKPNTGVKIEEHEPDVVEKRANDSSAPIQKINVPCPTARIPQEYFSNEEKKLPFGSGIGDQQKDPQKGKDSEIWRGWFPLDMSNLRPPAHGGDQKRTKDQDREEQKEFPYPVIWMPFCDNRQDNVGKNGNKDINSQDEHRAKEKNQFPFPIFWMCPYDNKKKGQEEDTVANTPLNTAENHQMSMRPCSDGNGSDDSRVNEEKPSVQNGKELKGVSSLKNIPVKQIESSKEEDNVEDMYQEEKPSAQSGKELKCASSLKNIPVKQIESSKEEDNVEDTDKRSSSTKQKEYVVNKPSGTTAKRKSVSPPKASKLPPVCLRVDPLPRKKNGNGSSRSPSPPGTSKRSEENSKPKADIEACLKESTQRDSKSHEDTVSNNKEFERDNKDKKVINVVEKKGGDNIIDSDKGVAEPVSPCLSVPSGVVVSRRASINESDVNETNVKSDGEPDVTGKIAKEAMEPKKSTRLAKSVDSERKLGIESLSEEEAAVLIQSAYRGYMVRSWEPLKKLKQMAEIQEQVADIRNQIQALELSYDVQKDNKHRVVIGEAIMRLLLRLDTIQGMHPIIRDVRKSLVRELVDLQERIDAVISKKYQELIPQKIAAEDVEEPGVEAEESSVSLSNDGNLHVEFDNGHEQRIELEKGEDLRCTEGEETPFPLSDDRPLSVSSNEHQERTCESGAKIKELDSECIVEPKDESSEVENGESSCQQNLCGELPNIMDNVLGTTSDASRVTQMCDNSEIEVWQELPLDVPNDEIKNFEPEKGEHVAAVAKEVQEAQVESTTSPEAHESIGPPILTVYEVPALSEINEFESVVREKNDDLVDEKGEHEGKKDGLSSIHTTLDENRKAVELVEENPSVESEEWLKVGLKAIKEIPCDSQLEVRTRSLEGEVTNDVVIELMNSSEEKESHNIGQEDEATIFMREEISVGENEHDDGNLSLVEEPEKNDQRDISETMKYEVNSAGTESTVVYLQKEEEKTLPSSPTCTLKTIDGSGGELRSDKQLIQENEKLREMLEKLMESGKEQLNVITCLTGRVKDLESKLARKKKSKNRQCKISSSSSRAKRSNVPIKERAPDVAM